MRNFFLKKCANFSSSVVEHSNTPEHSRDSVLVCSAVFCCGFFTKLNPSTEVRITIQICFVLSDGACN